MSNKLIRKLSFIFAVMFVFGGVLPVFAGEGDITLVSKNSSWEQGNELSYRPSISADGRFIAFYGPATNLTSECNNKKWHVYVHDQQKGLTTCVSLSSKGVQGNGYSYNPSISADGRYVAFYSDANNLVPDDTNGKYDVFVHDMMTKQNTRVSVKGFNTQVTDGDSTVPVISACGRYVAFKSDSAQLVMDDSNEFKDVFVRDLLKGDTTCVTCHGVDGPSDDISWGFSISISENGNFVAFMSRATNLVTGGSNGQYQVFVHNMETSMNKIVSVSRDGEIGNKDSFNPSISGDGRYIAFESQASNLIQDDNNNTRDIFVRDLLLNRITRVSMSSEGDPGEGRSMNPSISYNGRFVTFDSAANNLDPRDSGDYKDIFVHDRDTSETMMISFAINGQPAGGDSTYPVFSADGRFLAFESVADDLINDDVNNSSDVFLYQYGEDNWVYLPLILH